MTIALILSAFALSFTFAPFGARFLSYLTLIPLLLSIHKYPYKKVFVNGLIFGGAFALFHLWWLYFLIVPVEPVTKILLVLGVTVLFLYLALYTAVFSVLTKFLGLAFAPLIWAGLEFVRTKTEIGFPWGFLGYTQTPYTPIIQFASIFGVYGISAWVVWINLLIFWIFQKKHKITYLIVLILSFVLPIGYGIIRINTGLLQRGLKVALVQPNVSPNEKGDYKSRIRLTDDLLSLINKAKEEKPDLIVLPETATLVDITRPASPNRGENEELRSKLQTIVDSNNVYLFTGTPLSEPGSPIYYNGAVMFEPSPSLVDTVNLIDSLYDKEELGGPPPQAFRQIYRKLHLVPFSERIPYADRVPLFRKIETGDMGDCTPGTDHTIFTVSYPCHLEQETLIHNGLIGESTFVKEDSLAPRSDSMKQIFQNDSLEETITVLPCGDSTKRKLSFACLVCFESIFPDLTREFTKRGADMLVNITNDGWFGKTPGPYQHCELAVLRSVENGVPLIRCANNGISLIADPYGFVYKRTNLFTQTILSYIVPLSSRPTFYRRYGDIFIYCSFAIIVIGLARKPFRKKNKKKYEQINSSC